MDNGTSSYNRFLKGDDEGIVEIIRDYKDGLLLYINSYTDNIFLAEELMEETFFKIVTRRPRFHGNSSFKTWLYTIGRNVTIDYIRRSSKYINIATEDMRNDFVEKESVERAYIKEERKIIVLRALQKLRNEYQQVLYLIYFEEFSNAEAAHIMKKSKRQIENLIYRAKNSLKTELEKEGFIYEEL